LYSINLYFLCCSSSRTNTASADSFSSLFIKPSTSSCKNQTKHRLQFIMKRYFKQWWSTIPPNINKMNNHLSSMELSLSLYTCRW
jgi:hypothetical protein